MAGGAKRAHLRLDVFTRTPVWQRDNRPKLALFWNGVVLLLLICLGVIMGLISWNERPIVESSVVIRNPAGVTSTTTGIRMLSITGAIREQHKKTPIRVISCGCDSRQGPSLRSTGCVPAAEKTELAVVQVADETAAPLAEDLIKNLKNDTSKGQRVFQRDNIQIAVVEQTLAWLVSFNPTGWDQATFDKTKQPAFFQESLNLSSQLEACNGNLGYDEKMLPSLRYNPASVGSASIPFPANSLTLEGAYECSNCSLCHWDNMMGHFDALLPRLKVSDWVSFTPVGDRGGGCFKEDNYTGRYTGRFIMVVNRGRPIARLVHQFMQGLGRLAGIKPGYPLDIFDMKTKHVLRARDFQPYLSQERLQAQRNGSFTYMVVERGSAEWLLLAERYPDMSQTCISLTDQSRTLPACEGKSSACCAGYSRQSPGASQAGIDHSCVQFTHGADCQRYFDNFKLFPNDTSCLDMRCNVRVPSYALKKVYRHGLTSTGAKEKAWKKAETPSVRLLFSKALDMAKADAPLYASSVCTNPYTGQLVNGSRVYQLDCAVEGNVEVCWKKGARYHNVWDPPGAAASVDEGYAAAGDVQISCTFLEKQSFKAWAVANVGGILGALRALIFFSMMGYALLNFIPMPQSKQQEAATDGRPVDLNILA